MLMDATLKSQNEDRLNIVKKIDEMISFGILKEDIDIIIEKCRNFNSKNPSQFFENVISDLESKFVYSLDDVYIIEDLSNIKRFLKNRD